MSEGSEDEKSRFVQVRVPVGILDKIDKLIEENKFASRSEFFKRVAVEYLSGTNPTSLMDSLRDPEVRKEIREIVKEQL